MSSMSLHNLRSVVAQFAAEQRRLGNPVSPGTETFMHAATVEIHKYLEDCLRPRMSPSLEKTADDVTDNTPIRRELPESAKFRKVYKDDELDPPSVSASPAADLGTQDLIKRMKTEAPGAFVRHDAVDVRPEDLRIKHIDKQQPNGEVVKIPLLQLLTDDIREKCSLPSTPDMEKQIKAYLINHARSRADYQKQLEKSKPFREAKAWKECHKRPDRIEAQLRLEIIEDALKKGGRKMKKQVHKFPVHELEDLAAWLRKIVNETAPTAVPLVVESPLHLTPTTQLPSMRLSSQGPPSPSSEEKRKRKAMS